MLACFFMRLRSALVAQGTIPLAGLTSVEALQAMGAPWSAPNLTMVVTSGTGGTGYIGVQLAKAVRDWCLCVESVHHLEANPLLAVLVDGSSSRCHSDKRRHQHRAC